MFPPKRWKFSVLSEGCSEGLDDSIFLYKHDKRPVAINEKCPVRSVVAGRPYLWLRGGILVDCGL